MASMHLVHPFDLDTETDELDLFAEEVADAQRHDLPPNSLSTLGCECGLSTFFCYGCGLAVSASSEASLKGLEDLLRQQQNVDPIGNFQEPLNWAREKLNADPKTDKVAEVVQSVFRKGKG